MYFIKQKILRWWFRFRGKTPLDMPMVQYWKYNESVSAKLTTAPDGSQIMYLEGEKHPINMFPRGHLLLTHKEDRGVYTPFSTLKHRIKNGIFNDSWELLEREAPKEWIAKKIKGFLNEMIELLKPLKYDMVPESRLTPSVREIHRTLRVIDVGKDKRLETLRQALCMILQEDDAYRFRVQWIISIFNPSAWWFKLLFRNPIKDFDLALQELEHAEVVEDMKGRIRLLRRVLMVALEDPTIQRLFIEFVKEVDWNKVKLTEADKYHFRGKYFRVDLDKFDY